MSAQTFLRSADAPADAAGIAPQRAAATGAAAASRRGRGLLARAAGALRATVLAFACIHVAILAADVAIHHDPGAFNLFSVVEAQRLWPAITGSHASLVASFALGFAAYALALVALPARPRGVGAASRPAAARHTGPSRAARTASAPWRARDGGASAEPGVHPPLPALTALAPTRITLGRGFLLLGAGLLVHMAALAAIDHLVPAFPSVPDVVHQRLPYVNFGPPGELAYAGFMAAMIAVLLRTQPDTVPAVLAMLGLFYGLRGVFLFLLPIGSPPTAPALRDRFVFWPFAGHAYFPGGHTGMMTLLSLSVVRPRWRRAFLAATALFAAGTLLARTHYAADAFGGALLAYGIVLWGRRRFGPRAGGGAVARAAWSIGGRPTSGGVR